MREGRSRARRALLVALDVLVVLLVCCYFAGDLRLSRTDAVGDHPHRPTDGPGQDWLLVAASAEGRVGALLLLHIPHAQGRPTLIGLPRTAYAPVQGHGHNTFEAAYALGGPRSLVSTIETATGIRIDRYAELPVGAPVPERPGAFAGALDDVVRDPAHAVPLLADAAGSITVDAADHVHHLLQLAVALHRVGSGDAVTTTLPVGRRGSIAGVGPVALLDPTRISLLAVAIARDRPLPASLLTN